MHSIYRIEEKELVSKTIPAPFSLYNLNTREHILTLSFYHKRYNDDKIKRS